MDSTARAIIQSFNQNVFSTPGVDPKILAEVPFFRKLLQENFHNKEVFHGYINKIYHTWGSILSPHVKRLISQYNSEYDMVLLANLEKQKEMMRMADDYNAQKLFSELDDMSIGGGGIASLTRNFNKSGITKKKPSKRRR